MKLRSFLLLVLAAGCGSEIPSAEPSPEMSNADLTSNAALLECSPDGSSCADIAIAPDPDSAEACRQDRLIAVMQPGMTTCPRGGEGDQGYWKESRLFNTTRWVVGLNGVYPYYYPIPGLVPYCVYEWISAGGYPPDPSLLPSPRYFAHGPDPDCHVVSSLGSVATDVTWVTLKDAFLRQVGAVKSLPSAPKVAPVNVRVAVVDTSPERYDDGRPVDGGSGHGMAVGSIARWLGCPMPKPPPDYSCAGHCGQRGKYWHCQCDSFCAELGDCCADKPQVCDNAGGQCVAQVSNHLALGHKTPDAGDPSGGSFGTISELAEAIGRSVDAWVGSGKQLHLVINLSLGWEDRFNETSLSEKMAVEDALKYAYCWGAVTIAAAGNDPGGPWPVSGPSYPAAWEMEQAPTPDVCQKVYRSPSPPYPKTTYRPLVYAVGGVGGDDETLTISRPGAQPRLVAPAAFGVAPRYDLGIVAKPTEVLTGTSVAAAVTSGILATLWGYLPKSYGADLMDVIWKAGARLEDKASFCVDGSLDNPSCPLNSEVHRIGLCQSLVAACAAARATGEPNNCPEAGSLPTCTVREAYVDARPKLNSDQLSTIEADADLTVSGTNLKYSRPGLKVCQQDWSFWTSASYAPNPCPDRQFYSFPTEPWTVSWPPGPPCSACTVSLSPSPYSGLLPSYKAKLYIAIDGNTGNKLANPTLTIYRGSSTYSYSIPGIETLSAGDVVIVDDIPIGSEKKVGARLSFTVQDGSSVKRSAIVAPLVQLQDTKL